MMQKKKFDLTSDIINVDLKEVENDNLSEQSVTEQITTGSKGVAVKKKVLLTIAVDEDLRKEYKSWCARKGLKMNEAFLKGFDLLKKEDYT